MKKTSGFTLIELLIAVAILGILAAIAYPSYAQYLLRGKIIDATMVLSDYRVKMEQYYQDNRNYGTAGGACGVALPTDNYFTITCVAGNPNQTYTATATSKANMGAVGDYTYTINDANTKATSKYKGTSYTTKSCWLVKGSEC